MSEIKYHSYDELTDYQKAAVDAVASFELEGLERNTTGGAPPGEHQYSLDDVRERMLQFGSPAYKSVGPVSKLLKALDNQVIEDRKQVLANERGEYEGVFEVDEVPEKVGMAKTEAGSSNVRKAPDGRPELDMRWQYITERSLGMAKVEEGTYIVTLELDNEEMFDLIREADEETARRAFEAMKGDVNEKLASHFRKQQRGGES